MNVDSKKLKFSLSFLVITLPFIFLLSIFSLYENIKHSYQSFALMCTKTFNLLIGYLLHFENFWSIFILFLFSFALIKATSFFLSQVYKTKKLINFFKTKELYRYKKLHIVKSEDPFAVTAGYFSPQIFISSKTFLMLSTDELSAVYDHELYHQKNLHPLFLLVTKTLNKLLFFLPVFKNLSVYFAFKYEVMADKFSIDKNSKSSLSSALYKMIDVKNSFSVHQTVSAFSLTSDRVSILAGEMGPSFKISRSFFVSSVVIVLFLSNFLFDPVATTVRASDDYEQRIEYNVPVDCYSPTESFVSLVTFGQQVSSDANMTYGF